MSALEIYLWGMGVGVLIGWQTHALILDLAYHYGIVKYVGSKGDGK